MSHDLVEKYAGVVNQIRDVLSYFAVPSDLPGANRLGVVAKVNKRDCQNVFFCFVTQDGILIRFEVNMKLVNHDYIDNLMCSINNQLEKKRKQRAAERPIEIYTKPYLVK